jgi:hypothetical protein
MTAGEAPGGMAALVGGSGGSPGTSPRRNASSVKGQMGGRVGSSSSLADDVSDNEREAQVRRPSAAAAALTVHKQPELACVRYDCSSPWSFHVLRLLAVTRT